ncbi:MAG: heat-inducible transcription repressor HrcA [Candidatus Sericytochromatia bacterium]|nr:heat-inducible transcription repressor HrcA [Candidatus Sericytochromatia bacterium]
MRLEYRLSERKKAILNAVIRDYITYGEPLGSRTIVQRHGFTLSPATIRNEMAELEEAGLLLQPHTSAGRVPSDKGYRFFVDHLMGAYVPSQEELIFIRRLEQTSRAIDAILSQATRILAEATQSVALAETPRLRRNHLQELHFQYLDPFSLVLSLIYRNGLRRQSVLKLSHSIYDGVLDLLSNYLNTQLRTTNSLDELFHRTVTLPLEQEVQKYRAIVMEMVSEIYAQAQRDERVYLTGTSYLLREPEFQSMEQAYPILSFLDQEHFVRQLFHSASHGVQIEGTHHVYCLIGYENTHEELQHCSLVATPYFIEDKASGMIGVLGPTRMDYSKVTAILQTVASNISLTMSKLF